MKLQVETVGSKCPVRAKDLCLGSSVVRQFAGVENHLADGVQSVKPTGLSGDGPIVNVVVSFSPAARWTAEEGFPVAGKPKKRAKGAPGLCGVSVILSPVSKRSYSGILICTTRAEWVGRQLINLCVTLTRRNYGRVILKPPKLAGLKRRHLARLVRHPADGSRFLT
jgi:hypothetical protein